MYIHRKGGIAKPRGDVNPQLNTQGAVDTPYGSNSSVWQRCLAKLKMSEAVNAKAVTRTGNCPGNRPEPRGCARPRRLALRNASGPGDQRHGRRDRIPLRLPRPRARPHRGSLGRSQSPRPSWHLQPKPSRPLPSAPGVSRGGRRTCQPSPATSEHPRQPHGRGRPRLRAGGSRHGAPPHLTPRPPWRPSPGSWW